MVLRRSLSLAAALFLLPLSLSATSSGLYGDWKTSDGSTIRTFPCSQAVCLKIVSVSPTAPGTLDHNNPDPALRKRSLCNLEIGSAFVPSGDSEAKGGVLYDPMSGKTYKGNMVLNGDTLKLRGYIGVALFGRTETWQRTSAAKSCS